MRQNIESVVDRGEHLELLVDKSEGFNSNVRAPARAHPAGGSSPPPSHPQAARFQQQSRGLRKAMWWKNVQQLACLAGVVLFVILLVVSSVCGWDLSHCKHRG